MPPEIIPHKVCATCLLDKPLADYSRHNGHADGRRKHCKKCSYQTVKARIPRRPPVPDLPGEEWRPVVGYSNTYRVSNRGRVMRIVDRKGSYAGRLLGSHTSHGYLSARLKHVGRGKVSEYVHRLVAAAFIGPCPDGYEVNHVDANKQNNTPSNLEYVTHGENAKHAARLGLNSGELNGTHKLLESDVVRIKGLLKSGLTAKSIARDFGVARQTIDSIKQGRSWDHVTCIDQ